MKAVVFDMDGVIFDSERLVIKVWQKLGEKHGFSHVEDVPKSHIICTQNQA